MFGGVCELHPAGHQQGRTPDPHPPLHTGCTGTTRKQLHYGGRITDPPHRIEHTMNAPSSKYDSFRDSALHFLCDAGWGNESDGNAPEYGSHFTRITLDWEDVKPANTEFNSLIEQWAHYEEYPGDADKYNLRRSLTGHWIVSENSAGFVAVRNFSSEDAAKARFTAFAEHYARWQDSGDSL